GLVADWGCRGSVGPMGEPESFAGGSGVPAFRALSVPRGRAASPVVPAPRGRVASEAVSALRGRTASRGVSLPRKRSGIRPVVRALTVGTGLLGSIIRADE